MVCYSFELSFWINIGLSIAFACLLCIFVWITAPNTGMLHRTVLLKFLTILMVQWLSVALAVMTTLLSMCLLDVADLEMAWYAKSWLTVGLYAAPMLFVMSILPAVYLSQTKDHGLPLSYAVQFLLHSHCLLLVIVNLLALMFSIRSTFMITFSLGFYTLSMLLNILTCAHRTSKYLKDSSMREGWVDGGSIFLRTISRLGIERRE